MKKLSFMIIPGIILLGCGSKPAETTGTSTSNNDSAKTENNTTEVVQETSFGSLLIELESNVGWGAVNENWKTRRDSWLSDCETASDAASKGNLLLEFETIVNWDAVNPEWAKRRNAWISDVTKATTDTDLGKYLAEFESYILWDVVSPAWVDLRDGWIKSCQSL
ncbi:MAG: hypothetical protein IPM74_08080 [Crocinitomicaceae bacterium]|nr:hypothetical protein [Crocinitomicaceae bacterium]